MWWNSSWGISNPQRWCCDSAALNIPANLENSAVATGLEKFSFHSDPKERQWQRMVKLLKTALILHSSKAMLKILQARRQQYVNQELPDVHAGFRKGRGTRDQIANICWIIKKGREFQKNIYFCFTDYTKAIVKVLHSICQQIWKIHQVPQDWKMSVFIPIPKKGNAKKCSNYRKLHSFHTLAK